MKDERDNIREKIANGDEIVIPIINSIPIRDMLGNQAYMEKYWIPAIDYIYKVDLHWDSLEFHSWVRKLLILISPLPDIIVLCQTNSTPMFKEPSITDVKLKIAFLDSISERMYARAGPSFGLRELSLGNEINQKLMKATGKSPGFIERASEIVSTLPSLERNSQKGYATLTSLVSICTLLLCIVPSYFAWKYSSHQPGTTQDADFWYLVQSSGMQWLSVLTIIISIRTSSDLTFETWFWTWALVALAIMCPLGAILCYPYFPTEYSAMVSFIGGAAQGFVVLASMFSAPVVKKKIE